MVWLLLRQLRKWAALPEHLQELFRLSMDSSHCYRQHWYS